VPAIGHPAVRAVSATGYMRTVAAWLTRHQAFSAAHHLAGHQLG
jgi:hypothetical protein